MLSTAKKKGKKGKGKGNRNKKLEIQKRWSFQLETLKK